MVSKDALKVEHANVYLDVLKEISVDFKVLNIAVEMIG
jgi:hypothetical protein